MQFKFVLALLSVLALFAVAQAVDYSTCEDEPYNCNGCCTENGYARGETRFNGYTEPVCWCFSEGE